tara:strand:+ start:586 stop:948 length:363 start_codon:yes stop_codon:yes gene_type:complete
MLTFIKKIFTWWNQETLGTKIFTLLFGKYVGQDKYGNRYYENKKKSKRWVIYKDEIDASKIPNEWYSWIHFIKNKIEFDSDSFKYDWQKPHSPNLTGTKKAYHPNKNDEKSEKKYKSWKN